MKHCSDIDNAVKILQKGGLVVFPTETVYGLGADAKNPDAVSAIFQAKQRPAKHPIIVHIGTINEMHNWGTNIPEDTFALVRRYWPGPLTLVLKRASDVTEIISGGQDTVALRMPSHPVALELLRAFGSGIAAPSANMYGKLSPTSLDNLSANIRNAADAILDGGHCEIGIESTIVDLSNAEPRILRPGVISLEEIKRALGKKVLSSSGFNMRFPGGCKVHYAPNAPLLLVPSDELVARIAEYRRMQAKVAVISSSIVAVPPCYTHRFIPPAPSEWARQLYSALAELDRIQPERIIIELPPNGPDWEGVRDRLFRASNISSPSKNNRAI